MITTIIASILSITLGIGSLTWGYAEFGLSPLARWFMFFGAVWLVAQVRGWRWFSAIGLVITVLMASAGLWFGMSPGWMFSSGVFALIAWDLTEFRERFRYSSSEGLREMERRHIARLTILALAGLCPASLVMLARSQFTIAWTTLLIIMIVLAISQWLAGIRRY